MSIRPVYKICETCGKRFIVEDVRKWPLKKTRKMYFCSWKCLREAEKNENVSMS